MDLGPWQMAIVDRLEDEIPHAKFFIEGAGENTVIPRDPLGMVKPFAMVWFGSLREGGIGHEALTGTMQTTKRMNMIIQVAAGNGRMLLQLENAVRVALTGYRPDGEGELREDTASIRDPYPVGGGVEVRFYKPIAFSGIVGSRAVC